MLVIKGLNKKDHFILAVSAGVDSMVALDLLHRLNYNFSVFHFNHDINPDINDMMEELVRYKTVEVYKRNFFVKHNKYIESNGSIEDNLRNARLQAYKELESNIVVCHHLDDCCESYLMNCVKGHPEYCPIPVETELTNGFKIIRPFMLNAKSAFNDYAKRNNIDIVFDASNLSNDYRRNYFRNQILPRIPKEMGLQKVVKKKMICFYEKVLYNNQTKN